MLSNRLEARTQPEIRFWDERSIFSLNRFRFYFFFFFYRRWKLERGSFLFLVPREKDNRNDSRFLSRGIYSDFRAQTTNSCHRARARLMETWTSIESLVGREFCLSSIFEYCWFRCRSSRPTRVWLSGHLTRKEDEEEEEEDSQRIRTRFELLC